VTFFGEPGCLDPEAIPDIEGDPAAEERLALVEG